MVFPGLLATGLPVVVGLVFRAVGSATGRDLLGAEALAGYLMFGTVTGIMMALFLDNGTTPHLQTIRKREECWQPMCHIQASLALCFSLSLCVST
jgi:Na+/H+-translocating membrane pyrophosphatase